MQRGRNAPQRITLVATTNCHLCLGGKSRSGKGTTMHYSNDKNIASYVRRLVRAGWRYQMGGRHGKLISPAGRRIPVPCTPGDFRAFDNFKRDIRRLTAGLTL